jgi:tRNA threonylcarbamoyladenosine biosynthesis protein TsaB
MQQHGGAGVLAALDARMQEVYWGAYRRDSDGLVELDGEEVVCGSDQVPLPSEGNWIGAGSGWNRYGEVLSARCAVAPHQVYGDCYPRAGAVARLAEQLFQHGIALPPQQAIPVYLRDNVANKPATGD